MAARKPKVGDIAEIKTPRGLAYVQYTHDGKDMGELVRVLPGLYSSRVLDFADLASQRELYFIFYTLKYALRAAQTEIVSNQPVPDWAKTAPVMRHAAGVAPDGKILSWRTVSALAPLTIEFLQQAPVVRDLTPEQRSLSIHALRPHPAMVKELARGWTPERAESLEEQDRAQARARRASQQVAAPSTPETMRHYLYFRKKADAETVGAQLRNHGFSVKVRKGADGENWLALAMKTSPKTGEQMDDLRNEMESLATQFDGEYDGWEAAVATDGSEGMERVN